MSGRPSLEDRAAQYQPVRQFMSEHPAIDEVRVNVGMPMEFDPRAGETPKPDGIEFTIPNSDDLSVLKKISDACDEYDMEVRMPEYKQPNFRYSWQDGRGRERAQRCNTDVDYEAFIRLVPVRE